MFTRRTLAALFAVCAAASLCGCASFRHGDNERNQVDSVKYNERHSRAWNISRLFLYGTFDQESEKVTLQSYHETRVSESLAKGLANQIVSGGNLATNLLLSTGFGTVFVDAAAREEDDAWWTMVPAENAADLTQARQIAFDMAVDKTVAGFEKAGWQIIPIQINSTRQQFSGELPRFFNQYRMVKPGEKCSAPKDGEPKDAGCRLVVEMGASPFDSITGLPDWFGGAKDVRMVRTVFVKYGGKRDNGELFLTPSSEDRLQVAAQAKGNQLFYGAWRRHEVAYVSENGTILKFVYPAGKAPTTGEKFRHDFFQSLPFVKRSDEPV